MSWISTLVPWQWAVLAAVPTLIVLMYFLKLRREVVEVPSTYLWLKTIEDLHVNSLLQRLRRSILLLLQLLAVLMATLALLRPGVRGEAISQSRLVFMIDTSASMQATDVEKDASRFEQAKRLVAERIETMQDSESAMIVAFDSRAEVLQSFTSDRGRLRDALNRLQVTDRTTDVLAALRAADGLAATVSTVGIAEEAADSTDDAELAERRTEPAELILYSDGGFPSVADFQLDHLIPQFVAVGTTTPSNLAITAFSAERNPDRPNELQTFATIANYGGRAMSTTATLSIAGNFVDAAAVELEPGEQTGISFKLKNDDAVSMKLTLDNDDDLAIDNVAFAGLAPAKTVSVLVVSKGNTPLELALQTLKAGKICNVEIVPPSYLATDEYKTRAAAAREDLIIFDRCSPPVMPTTNTFFIGSLPLGEWSWASEPQPVVLIDIDRTHPLMRYVEILSLLVYKGRALAGPSGMVELVGADLGPVLAIAPRDGYQDLVLGFEVVSESDDGSISINTNWYTERSWPVFMLNTLKFLAGAAEGSAAQSYQPGSTVRLRLDTTAKKLNVIRDGGQAREVSTGVGGTTEFTSTDEVGNYRVQIGDVLADSFAVNLFDRRESTLAVADELTLGYQTVSATSATTVQRHEYWRWMLFAMLGLLLTEWWLYARRLG